MLQTQTAQVLKFNYYHSVRKFLRVNTCIYAQCFQKACTVVNVSSGGAGLIFVERIDPGSNVKIEIQTNSGLITLSGKIVWSTYEGPGIYPAGMEFYETLPINVFVELVEE